MDLEIGSDDDLFQGEKDVSKVQHAWSPKQCEPECVLIPPPSVQDDRSLATTERAQIFCHRGDYLYSKGRYASALAAYSDGLAMVPVRYVILRRILLEGAARCCVRLQDCTQALHMAAKLLEESLTIDHRMTAHSLLATVHAAAGNQLEAIQSLQVCIRLHRSNVHFWLRLAKAYSALYCQSSPTSGLDTTRGEVGDATCSRCVCRETRAATSCAKGHGSGNEVSLKSAGQPVVDVGEKRPKASGSGPQEEASLRDVTDAGCAWGAKRNQPAAPPEGGHCLCDGIAELRLDPKSVPVSELTVYGDGPVSSSNRSAPNNMVREATFPLLAEPRTEVSVASWLNELDTLTLTEDDAVKDCDTQTRAQLTCRGCQPLHCSASCLLRARLLLKSVSHSVRSFVKEQNGRSLCQVEEALQGLGLSPGLLRVLHLQARQIVRRGHYQQAGVVTGETEEGGAMDDADEPRGGDSGALSEEFERDWFPWLLS